MMDGFGGMGLFGAIVMLLFFVAVVLLVVWAVRAVIPSPPDTAASARLRWIFSHAATRRAGSIRPRSTRGSVSSTARPWRVMTSNVPVVYRQEGNRT